MAIYSLGLVLALAATSPVWGWRMLRQGRYRQGLRERLGGVPERLRTYVRGRDVVWVHAVSVGEVLAAARLIELLQTALPDFCIVLSTTTPTGQRVARERFGADRVFFFPLDFAFAVRRYLHVLRPRLLVLVESELWPRMLVEGARAGVAIAVVNARVSDRSLPRYVALRALWRPLLGKADLLLAQSEEDARRWVRIGAPAARVRSAGNLKFDLRSAEQTPLVSLVREHLPADAAVLVCGSTHDGEEALLLRCWQSCASGSARVILAPRHPERASVVAELVGSFGLKPVALSVWRLAPRALTEGDVLLVDTVGELAALYALARVAFVGGSLIAAGGHNPLEGAQFGVPVVMGEHFENFREIVDGMRTRKAIRITTQDTLCEEMRRLMLPEADAREESGRMGERGRLFFEEQAGATERTVHALVELLHAPAAAAGQAR